MTPEILFEILVREHAEMLTASLRAVVRDPQLVDEIFQETLITAWKTLDRYDKSRPFGPWLRGIAGKLMLAARRKRSHAFFPCDEQTLEFLEARHAALHRQSGDTLDEKLACLRTCLESLPEPYREALKQRYQSETPAATLAQQLRISLETLKKRLQRGRARLLDCLERKLASSEALS